MTRVKVDKKHLFNIIVIKNLKDILRWVDAESSGEPHMRRSWRLRPVGQPPDRRRLMQRKWLRRPLWLRIKSSLDSFQKYKSIPLKCIQYAQIMQNSRNYIINPGIQFLPKIGRSSYRGCNIWDVSSYLSPWDSHIFIRISKGRKSTFPCKKSRRLLRERSIFGSQWARKYCGALIALLTSRKKEFWTFIVDCQILCCVF